MSARAMFLQRMATRGGWIRQSLFWLHLAAGILAGLVILVLAGTGMVLAFEDQAVGWAERKALQVPAPAEGAQRLSLDQLAAKALQGSQAERVSGFTLERDPRASVRFQLGRDQSLLMDPYSGQSLGAGADGLHAWFHKVEDLHRYFLMEGKAREKAKTVKNAANAAFLLLIVSGLFLWWPKAWDWQSLKSVLLPRWAGNSKARDFNWHNALGFLFWPAIFSISLTGLIMSYAWANDLLYKATGNTPPPRPTPAPAAAMAKPEAAAPVAKAEAPQAKGKRGQRAGAKAPRPEPTRFEQYFKAAEAQVPDWKSITYRAPRPGQDTVSLSIVTEDAPPPRGRGMLSVDLKSAAVKKWEPYAGQNAGRKLRLWARWTHTGQSLGLLGQVLAFFAAGAILVLVYTGLALSWRRFTR